MTTNADRVRDFHHAIGADLPARPAHPDARLLELRRTLIREEYTEVMQAMDDLATYHENTPGEDTADLASLAQELADLLYVTYGALLALGADPDEVFAEVHRANMLKTTGPRRADGKQLKPDGFRPADIQSVLERLAGRS